MADVSPARRAAFRILLAVERGQSHSDDLLRANAVNVLSTADRNLVTTLVLGVLRWQIRLDHCFRPLLKRPNAKLDPEILIALRLGVFQLLFLDRIPAHAAIGESVELAIQAGHRFASGMVNAVLRKLGALPFDSLEERTGELDAAQAHPSWMVDRWTSAYGIEAARSICLHGQTQPPLTARIESPAVEVELEQEGVRLAPGELLTSARIIVSGDIAGSAAFLEGRARIQDEGSQLIAEIAAHPAEDLNQKVKSIVDACAAPGGKTLILAERNPHAHILACESSPKRLAQLESRLAVHSGRIECRLGDATALEESSVFDLALADVPCSGTGTLGRNPEIRHRLRPEDLPRQAERQRAILTAALRAVRPGGSAVYSTCSLEPEENEQVVAAVLKETPDARLISLEDRIESLLGSGILTRAGADHLSKCITREGALRLLPGKIHSDGFFIALFEKSA